MELLLQKLLHGVFELGPALLGMLASPYYNGQLTRHTLAMLESLLHSIRSGMQPSALELCLEDHSVHYAKA